MIVDAHNHADWHGHNLEKFIDNMDRYHIDKTWLLTWESPMHEVSPVYHCTNLTGSSYPGPITLERCLSYVERAPERFVLGFCPDPRLPESLDRLKNAVTMYGVRICGEMKMRMMYDNPDAVRMFRWCGEHGLPVTLHLDYEYDTGSEYPRRSYWYGGGIDCLERLLQKCPETNFLGHAPGFWCHISDDQLYLTQPYPKGPVVLGGKIQELLYKYPNLYCDISAGSGHNALSRDRDYTRWLLTEFQDRVLYARDYFDNIHQELLNSLGLPAPVLEKIYSQNALRLVPLD